MCSGLTAGIFGGKLSIKDDTVNKLKEKFRNEELEKFIPEFDIAGRVEALTESGQQLPAGAITETEAGIPYAVLRDVRKIGDIFKKKAGMLS